MSDLTKSLYTVSPDDCITEELCDAKSFAIKRSRAAALDDQSVLPEVAVASHQPSGRLSVFPIVYVELQK